MQEISKITGIIGDFNGSQDGIPVIKHDSLKQPPPPSKPKVTVARGEIIQLEEPLTRTDDGSAAEG